jgi:endonuclease/exonuclease/phosphatase family metal-dependent hydrolase
VYKGRHEKISYRYYLAEVHHRPVGLACSPQQADQPVVVAGDYNQSGGVKEKRNDRAAQEQNETKPKERRIEYVESK